MGNIEKTTDLEVLEILLKAAKIGDEKPDEADGEKLLSYLLELGLIDAQAYEAHKGRGIQHRLFDLAITILSNEIIKLKKNEQKRI